jgi:hypothetical protein
MNFVISNTVPNARVKVYLRIVGWLGEHLDGDVTTINVNNVISKNDLWSGVFAKMGLCLPDDFRMVYVTGMRSEHYSVFNIISRHVVTTDMLGEYRGDIVVWVNDENMAIQCKLACI